MPSIPTKLWLTWGLDGVFDPGSGNLRASGIKNAAVPHTAVGDGGVLGPRGLRPVGEGGVFGPREVAERVGVDWLGPRASMAVYRKNSFMRVLAGLL